MTTKTPLRSIETYDDGFVFEKIEGRIEWVEDPRDPTPAQAKNGIHTQDITVGDDSGTKIKFRIIKPQMHLDRSCKDQWFGFESTNNAGALNGVVKTSWQKPGGPLYHNIEINGNARVYALAEQPAAPQQTQPQQQAPAPAQPQQQAQVAPQQVVKEMKPETVQDIAEQWCRIYAASTPIAKAAGVPESQWGPLATHIRMEFRNRPVEFRGFDFSQLQPEQPPAGGQDQAQPEDESWKETQFGGHAIFDLPHNELCVLICDVASYTGDDADKLAMKKAAAKTMKSRNITWAEVYDIFSGKLKQTFTGESVDQTHDTMRQSLKKGGSDEDFYKMLILNRDDFKSGVEALEKSK